jgi:hypothetical protein
MFVLWLEQTHTSNQVARRPRCFVQHGHIPFEPSEMGTVTIQTRDHA